MPPSKRTLLLTLDAFETLFHPREPVPIQYAKVAHSFGLSPSLITPDRLKQSFKTSFKVQSARYPNHGRDEVLKGRYAGPRQWWKEIITRSFGIALGYKDRDADSIRLPDGLVKTLLENFAGKEAYELYPDVGPFFERLRAVRNATVGAGSAGRLGVFDRLVVGVISNSDDRVPDILKSLGLTVGKTRADRDVESSLLQGFEDRASVSSSSASSSSASFASATSSCVSSSASSFASSSSSANDAIPQSKHPGLNDIDLVITSYDAGAEKPSPAIFDVAKKQAQSLVGPETESSQQWTCVHVGDDYEKDYVAAIQAGWDGVFLPREEGHMVDGAKPVGSLFEVLRLLERYP